MNAADRLEASLVPLSEKPLDGVIDGLSTLDAWSLWTPISTPITPPAVTWLLDETLAIWHVGSGGSRSGAAQERGRAFGVGSKVVGELAYDANGVPRIRRVEVPGFPHPLKPAIVVVQDLTPNLGNAEAPQAN